MIGLVVSIALLALLSYLLWGVISRQSADNQYRRAVDYLADGDHLNAVRQFDQFLTTSPEIQRAGKARVLRSLATCQAVHGRGRWRLDAKGCGLRSRWSRKWAASRSSRIAGSIWRRRCCELSKGSPMQGARGRRGEPRTGGGRASISRRSGRRGGG